MRVAAAAACLFAAPAASADSSYRLGHGLDVGPFNIAGYSSLEGELPASGNDSVTLDDLSVFVSGHVDKLFNPFVEAEFTHFDIAASSHDDHTRGQGEFVLERIYNDAELGGGLTLRVGKMLAPVGEWNQVHAPPLVLTTVRPAVTFRGFSEYATGASLIYSDAAAALPDIQVYWQPSGEFSERPATLTFHQYREVEGAHVTFPFQTLDKLGVSFQRSTDSAGADETLFGLDFNYTYQQLTLEGESTYASFNGGDKRLLHNYEWGAYVAASYALSQQWSAFTWYEVFAERNSPSAAHDVLLGIAYRPHNAVVIKLEYLQNVGGRTINPTGLFASWSVLF